MPFDRRLLIALMLIRTLSVYAAETRPKIGVALGGGGALGIAHVGVLLWMERNHIPIDVISGTSMGALIAGSYATGMTADEVEDLVKHIDWNAAFRGSAPFSDLRYRRKEDKLAFPNRFELGFKHGIVAPSGLNSGFGLTLLLDRLFMAIPANQSFDKLPTPFRCISTDIVTGNRVEIGDGPLAEALRASAAIPGFFEPVRRNGQVLVDGGIVDNLPVESARGLGADIVIAVVLPVASLKPDQIQGIEVLSRSFSIAIVQNERQSEKKAQFVIEPDVGSYSSTDYRQYEVLIKKGMEAAAKNKEALLKYALNDADWAEFVRLRELRRQTSVPSFQHVEINGASPLSAQRLERELAPLTGDQNSNTDSKQIETILLKEYGTARYRSAGYDTRVDADGERTLEVNLGEKLNGPPFVYVNPEVRGEDSGRTDLTVNSRFLFMDVGGQDAEARIDLSVGTHTLLGAEYYHRIRGTGWFWAPHASFDRLQDNYYVAGNLLGEFDVRQAIVGFDAGYTSALDNEFRLGFDYGRVGAGVDTGVVPLANQGGVVKSAKLQFTHDGQDSEQVPSRGLRFSVTGRYYFDAPVSSAFPLLRLDASWFHPVITGAGDRVFLLGSGGSSFGNQLAVPLEFTLGGPLRLGAYGIDEFRGDRIGYGSAGWLHRIGNLPPVLGGSLFIGGWYEAGGYSIPGQQTFRQDGTIGFVAETPLGPFYTGWSLGHASGQWKGKFSFLVGRFF
jgi:NTE family protein